MSDREAKRGSYIGQAWLVILLALLYGAALAAVQLGWSDKIAENKLQKAYSRIPDIVGLAADGLAIAEVDRASLAPTDPTVYRVTGKEDGRLVGWVIRATGQGFADDIELLVGVDPAVETITGLRILSQKETPGLGDYITDPVQFTDQFSTGGKSAVRPLTVSKEKTTATDRIDAVSGATISSESVATIVNRAIGSVREKLRKLSGEAALPATGEGN